MSALALLLAAGAALAPPEDPATPPLRTRTPGVEETRQAVARGVAFLIGAQNEDGSFGGVRDATFTSAFANPGTYHCWTVGSTGLAVQALMELGEGEAAESAVRGGLAFLVKNAALRRPAEWDLDNNWGLIYGLHALALALRDPRFAKGESGAELRAAAETMVAGLARFQGARGGWGYYADPEAGWRPDWGTSFTTAAAILALLEARASGVPVDEKVLKAAIVAVERARLPNGAYGYDVSAVPRRWSMESIDQVKGSLGRIQVCNWALHRAGRALPENAIEEGVATFFEHHKFLDVARNKPIPHEAYYANAAYFYLFGHYYASFTIECVEGEARERYRGALRREVLKCQQPDGAFWDFWIAGSTKAYGTAFAVMALARTLAEPPVHSER